MLLSDDEPGWVRLTYEEESSLAQAVMSALAHPGVQEEEMDFLRRIYLKKTLYGKDIVLDDLDGLVRLWDAYGIVLPEITPDGTYMPLERTIRGRKLSLEEQVDRRAYMVVMAWYDAWEQHRTFRACAQEFQTFPNRNITREESEDRVSEEEFWNEVDRVSKEMGISSQQAFYLVRDYLPR